MALLFTVCLPLLGQAPAPKQYQRGRIPPKNLAQMKQRSVLLHGHKLKALPRATAADYDCRTLGIVGPVQDQGQCGSCWNFSGTGVVTFALYKAGTLKNDGTTYLCQQYTMDCYNNGGCNGDDNTTVTEHAKNVGLPTQADYGPYTASSGNCRYNSSMKLYRIKDWGFCTTDGNGVASTQDIKNCMVQYGPIGCAVDAGGFDSYSGGVFQGRGHSIDHDVILVGWHDDPQISTGGYWIMLNSWGTGWGEQGYMKIAYGSNDIGTEAIWVDGGAAPPPPSSPVITSPIVASAVVGQTFTYQITATNNPSAYNATGLPVGLTVNQSTGAITGSPTVTGTSSVVISAANSSGLGSATLVLTVSGTPTPGLPVTITLTPDQVQQVIDQSGTVTISPNMTVPQLLDALDKIRTKKAPPKTTEPPVKSSYLVPSRHVQPGVQHDLYEHLGFLFLDGHGWYRYLERPELHVSGRVF
jgi:hypothetical protein